MARFINEAWNMQTGTRTQQVIPWEAYVLGEAIAEYRWQRETMGITVGKQLITTQRHEMPIWQGMLLDITLRPGATPAFEYKPQGGENTSLTVAQVLRCYECFAWYVNACFATERTLKGMISGSSIEGLDAIAALAFTPSTWPQTSFLWVP